MSNGQQSSSSAPFSLIKYQAEIEISDNVDQYEKAKNNQKVLDPNPSPQDVLNNMILPRDWKATNGRHFMQYVSHQKSQRSDVVKLKQALDQALAHRQARIEGICPIRQELFSQAFDEIIRQVAINSPQRGLLLMRVKDQHKMTLAAYQTLYHSSVLFGKRKLEEAEQGMEELRQLLLDSETKKKGLENKKIELLSKKQSLQKKILQRKGIQRQNRQDQIVQIQEQENALSKFLNSLKEATKTD